MTYEIDRTELEVHLERKGDGDTVRARVGDSERRVSLGPYDELTITVAIVIEEDEDDDGNGSDYRIDGSVR